MPGPIGAGSRRVSDWRDDTFAFLRCGVDHHTVNFVVDPVPQLHHIAFEVKDWPEIHRACVERFRRLGLAILFEDVAPPHQPDGLIVATRDDARR